jgi:hypothetical protein
MLHAPIPRALIHDFPILRACSDPKCTICTLSFQADPADNHPHMSKWQHNASGRTVGLYSGRLRKSVPCNTSTASVGSRSACTVPKQREFTAEHQHAYGFFVEPAQVSGRRLGAPAVAAPSSGTAAQLSVSPTFGSLAPKHPLLHNRAAPNFQWNALHARLCYHLGRCEFLCHSLPVLV